MGCKVQRQASQLIWGPWQLHETFGTAEESRELSGGQVEYKRGYHYQRGVMLQPEQLSLTQHKTLSLHTHTL